MPELCLSVPGHLRPVSTRLNFTHAFTPLLAVEAVFGDVPVVLEFTFTGFSFSVSHIHLTCNREIDRNGSESHRGSPPESWLVLDFREFPKVAAPQEHCARRPVLRKKRVHSQNRQTTPSTRGLGAEGAVLVRGVAVLARQP